MYRSALDRIRKPTIRQPDFAVSRLIAPIFGVVQRVGRPNRLFDNCYVKQQNVMGVIASTTPKWIKEYGAVYW